MKMKECELCNYPARMYCESDQASLCWDCDEKVHGANFLVARHSRSLLCHVCQSPTPWKASGLNLKFGHTVSLCENCVTNCNSREHERCVAEEEIHGRNDEEDDVVDEDDDDADEDENGGYSGGEDDEDGKNGDNQVVPWSCIPPPPVASSSSSQGESTSRFGGGGVSMLKRRREDADLDSDDDIGCSSQRNYNRISTALTLRAPGDYESSSFRPLKQPRTTVVSHSAAIEADHDETKSNSKAIISSLKRF